MLDASTLMSEITAVLADIGVDVGVIVRTGVSVGIAIVFVVFGIAEVIVVFVESDVNNLVVVIVVFADDKGLAEVVDVAGGGCLGVDLVMP